MFSIAVALNYGVFRRKVFNTTSVNYMFFDIGASGTTATIVCELTFNTLPFFIEMWLEETSRCYGFLNAFCLLYNICYIRSYFFLKSVSLVHRFQLYTMQLVIFEIQLFAFQHIKSWKWRVLFQELLIHSLSLQLEALGK